MAGAGTSASSVRWLRTWSREITQADSSTVGTRRFSCRGAWFGKSRYSYVELLFTMSKYKWKSKLTKTNKRSLCGRIAHAMCRRVCVILILACVLMPNTKEQPMCFILWPCRYFTACTQSDNLWSTHCFPLQVYSVLMYKLYNSNNLPKVMDILSRKSFAPQRTPWFALLRRRLTRSSPRHHCAANRFHVDWDPQAPQVLGVRVIRIPQILLGLTQTPSWTQLAEQLRKQQFLFCDRVSAKNCEICLLNLLLTLIDNQ